MTMAASDSHRRMGSALESGELMPHRYPFTVFEVAVNTVRNCLEELWSLHDSLDCWVYEDEVQQAVRAEVTAAWKYAFHTLQSIATLADQLPGAFDDIPQDVLDKVVNL